MKTFFFTLFSLFFIPLSLFAQINFEENIVIDNTYYPDNPRGIYSADLDGDGDLDVISASSNDDKIAWYKNLDGLGKFDKLKVISSTANGAYSVYSADLDGDGDMDVLSASNIDDKIAWYRNLDGQGNFSAEIVISTNADSARSVYASDIDGDGDMDVISASNNDDKIAWYQNLDGAGNFSTELVVSTTANGARTVYSEDIDGDGDMDILSASHTDSKIAWYKNTDGQGTFGPEIIITDLASGAIDVIAKDIDGDGDLDVLSASYFDNKIAWYQNIDGLGTFGAQQLITTNIDDANAVYASDIDGDGDLDVLSASYNDNKIAWYENTNGMGVFGAQQVISTNATGTQKVIAFDIDGDGNVDVLSSSLTDDKVVWYKNTDGLGDFSSERMVSYSVNGASSAYPTDINGDGKIDILSTSAYDGKVSWFQNNDGLGNYDLQQIISTNSSSSSIAFSADIDNDGDMDVISADGVDGNVVWHKNIDGQGAFDPEQIIENNLNNVFYVYAADVDGDNDLDIIAATSAYVSRIVWFENLDGQGNFGALQTIANDIDDSNQTSVSVADLDGDGDLDILSSSANNDTIDWYKNLDGLGTFSSQIIITTTADGAESVSASDIDGDNDLDLIVTNRYGQDKVAWYENTDGQGAFGVANTIASTLDSATSFGFGVDIDNDNDIDVLAASSGTGYDEIFYYENTDGLGNFGAKQIIADNIDLLTSVYFSDINADGEMDVLASAYGENKVTWYKNIGLSANQINGSVTFDADANGCDVSDASLQNILVTTTNGSESFSMFTLANGVFQLFPSLGDFTTETIISTSPYFNIAPQSQVSNFTGLGNTDYIDFCITPNGTFNDLSVGVYPILDEPRPGFDTLYQIVYKNEGTTVLNGDISFQFDDAKLNFLYASQTISSQTTNTLTFDYSNLNPFETRVIYVLLNVYAPPTTQIDDVLNTIVTANPVAGDNTPEDNVFDLSQTVIGSYDPNDISVLEGEQILITETDKYLHYIIRFQNTGTASAINVRVNNVLDSKLDWTTLQLESLSHTGRVEITNGSNVDFIFDNINLADSTNDEPNSHGFIAYKIKPKDNVVIGDTFYNTADIFFDFNPEITTNTVATTVVQENLSVDNFEISSFVMFPNPAKKQLNISGKTMLETVTILDVNGRVLKTIHNSTNNIQINITDLSSGVYFVQIDSGQQKEVKKFVKE